MEYLENGVFNLDMSNLNMISVMNRALYNKVFNIDVFISENKITILSIDLSGNTIYILSEQDINKNQIINPNRRDIDLNIGNVFQNNELDNEIDLDVFSDEDLASLDSLIDQPMGENVKVSGDNSINLNWSDDIESNKQKEPDFGIDILSKSLNSMENTEFPEDFEEITTEISEEPSEIKENLVVSTQNQVCRFSTSIKMLKSLALFKKVTIKVEDDVIKLISKEDMVSLTFPRIKSYSNLDKYNKMVREIKWEKFPADMVRKVIPLVDRIEPNKQRQKLSIKNGRIYMYSDQIAVSVRTSKTYDNYVLTNDMLRIMKYATSRMSSVYVGYYNKGLAFNIDGLIVIYSLVDKDIPKNLIDLLNEDKLIFSKQVSKHTTHIWNLIDTVGEDKSMLIEISPEKAKISTNKLSAFTDLTGERTFSFDLLINRILLALKIVGTKTPNLDIYLLGNKVVLSVSNKDLRVIIEGSNYSEKE